MSAPRSVVELPLTGIRAVEANAGTGKTFTIATLYLRLILEQGLAPAEIVVATFTRAATAELAERLRDWLAKAAQLLARGDVEPAPDDAEAGEVCRVIRQALAAGMTRDELWRRARGALTASDTAQISTLHGFCFRVLGELGFEAGAALRRPEPIDDLRELDLEIIRDFWRRGSDDGATARVLAETWGSPEHLARQASDGRWDNLPEDFDPRPPAPDIRALHAAFDAARARIAAWGEAEQQAFQAELLRCVSTARTQTARLHAWQALRAWASAATTAAAFAGYDPKLVAGLGADALEKLQPKGERPAGQVFDGIAALQAAHAAIAEAPRREAACRAANLLCDARARLVDERKRRLAERDLASHDQAVQALRAALRGPGGEALVAAARARWKAALIDEFQDTDGAQWEIVEALFGATTLVLVGDPKQAIYAFRGGDVYAWQRAFAPHADDALRLATSHRSGERLCQAINTLFGARDAFLEAGIGYHDVEASLRSRACGVEQDGQPLPGIRFWHFSADDLDVSAPRSGGPGKGSVQPEIERRTVAAITALLQSAQLVARDGTRARLAPKHIAVLVNSNREAASMQAALGRAGIPASSNLRASVYASAEAGDLALLLAATADPADPARARAAWASRLVGKTAADIAAAADAGGPLVDAGRWALALGERGALAWLRTLVAAAAPRLLQQPDGARRVANYLQLAELLQGDAAAGFGAAELAARFPRARAGASERDTGDADAGRLRLETDLDAVTVATVHAAKGLEYDVVFLPYACLGKDPKQHGEVPLHWYHEDGDARLALGDAPPAVAARARREALAEDVRKLYVAITRARALCVIPWGWVNLGQHTALFHLLHAAQAQADAAQDWSDAGCAAALEALRRRAAHGALDVERWSTIHTAGRYNPAAPPPRSLAAASFTRTGLERDWTVWSFSRLVRGSHNQAADPAPGAHDDDTDDGARLGGARFGTAVHAVFERTDFAAWRDTDGVPPTQRELIERALAAQGLPEPGVALPQAVDLVGRMLRDALNTPLACGTRLAEVAPAARRAEIEFHLALAPADSARLYALLHKFNCQTQRERIAPANLAGLLTGKIDLAFRHANRFYLVDWKTNRCPPYDAAALQAEIARHDYDLQWLIYTLALHRWLRATLADYAYARDFGGAYYLFVRGMQGGHGVHVERPPFALIEALDTLFLPMRGGAA